MNFHAALCVFESWAPDPDNPAGAARVTCCGRLLPMRAGVIVCDVCDTAIEKIEMYGERWRVLRVKGRPFPTPACSNCVGYPAGVALECSKCGRMIGGGSPVGANHDRG